MDDNLKKLLGLPNVEVVESIDQIETEPGDIILVDFPREAMEKGRLEPVLREFERYSKKKSRSSILINYSGYDSDPREVYQIPEIRKFMDRLFKNVPHLFYLLAQENHAMLMVFLCLAPAVRQPGGQVNIEIAGGKRLIEKAVKSAVSFAKKAGDSPNLQHKLAETILAELGYDAAGEGNKKAVDGIEHVTLNSGHSRITTSADVDKELYFILQRLYRDSQKPDGVMMPDGYRVKTTVFPEGAVSTVYGPSDAPVLTTLCVREETDGTFWRWLHKDYDGEIIGALKTDPNKPPKAPYIADRLEIGSTIHFDAMAWTGSFARCFGWIVLSPESVR
ncbi:hypothetical protein [Paenibacillus jiagnxiensis]|uniref:hypothetical protein n=1 Tax=Paenibacillus jiagnxiensis TaxID=3228926 RepID=UPI00349AF430